MELQESIPDVYLSVYEQIFHFALVEFEDVKNTLGPKDPTIPTENTDKRAEVVKNDHPHFTEGELKHEQLNIFFSGCTEKGQQMQGCEGRSPESHPKCSCKGYSSYHSPSTVSPLLCH